MTQEAFKLALEALELVNIEFVCNGAHHAKKDRHSLDEDCPVTMRYRTAITAIKEALAQEQEPVAHSVITGVLFDFMGWLTSRNERIVLSSADEASPAVDAIRDFAKMRGLSLDDAKVLDWNTPPPQRTWAGLTDEKICLIAHNTDPNDWDDLTFKKCWHEGFKAGFREAEIEHNIKG